MKFTKKILKESLKELMFQVKLLTRRPNYSGKVFCIGYNKTGTTSCGKAFELLGYYNCSFNKKVWRKWYAQGEIEKIIRFAAKFDSFDDLPWLKEDMIPLLDKRFPNSKFIYLTRDEKSWKKSYYNWTHKVTGTYPDVDNGWQSYKNHEKFVLNYFKNMDSNKFLILSISEEESFKKLASFLGKETRICDFPHENKTIR